ncbi:hypothetical protein [Streptomyces sp. NPDC001933]|uniref:hypothetical protein n=1 Tax=Streptomyces sp. NPDC001933 TaxID=3364626 RepID=UPI00367FBA8C
MTEGPGGGPGILVTAFPAEVVERLGTEVGGAGNLTASWAATARWRSSGRTDGATPLPPVPRRGTAAALREAADGTASVCAWRDAP